ncbi:MAG TPA: hypothetical protein VKY27_04515 [Bacteriovoracaceae bacterium]|nr:hypothetical protein [Bacteriovoracaceae bacterium]
MKLEQRLLELALQKKLAHFYILEPTKSSPEAQVECEDFCETFLKEYFKASGVHCPESVWNHPDVLTFGNRVDQEEVSSNFTVEEALSFIRYFEFAPVNAPHKFAIITQASRINTIVANKWLKLLEEPNKESTIILINSQRIKLLETIESRGILLRLHNDSPINDLKEFEEFLKESQGLKLSEFIEKNQKSSKDLSYWTNKLILWEAQRDEGAQEKTELGQWLLKLKEMETFHQPSATKWALFYQYLQTNVFSRLIR